jgi:DNA-directed RNA polymerase I, II, and III subunit RPABC2
VEDTDDEGDEETEEKKVGIKILDDDDDDDSPDTDDEAEDDDGDDEDETEEEEDAKDDLTSAISEKSKEILASIMADEDEIVGQDKDDDEDEYTDDEDYLEKFSHEVRHDYIMVHHNDILQSNYDEISALTKVVRDSEGNVVDPLHKTLPILTKFERARVLGLRAKQINMGADPFIKLPDNVIEGYVIAEMELEQNVLPYIIARPLPGGKKEYWRIQDLEHLKGT